MSWIDELRYAALLALAGCATSPTGDPDPPSAATTSILDAGTSSPDSATRDAKAPAVGGDASNGDSTLAFDAAGKKRLFATHTEFAGTFGGVAGGDAICVQAARDAGLDGTWKAWLSDDSASASARLAIAGPWILVDGTLAFPGNLSGTPVHDLDMDEHGEIGIKGIVWTGTTANGQFSGKNCGGWSSGGEATTGYAGSAAQWTDDGSGSPCSFQGRIYCIEQ